MKVGRRAWGSPVCLALGRSPHLALIAFQALPTMVCILRQYPVQENCRKILFQESMAGLVPTQHEFNHQCFPLYRFATEPHSMFWNCIAILSLLSAMGNPKVNYSFESWHRRSWTSSVALNSLAPGWHWGERWKTSSFNLQPIPLSKHHFGLKSAPISKYDTFIF